MKTLLAAPFLALALLAAPTASAGVKVFILAGQSNMEGKVQNQLLEHQAKDPGTAELFEHLREGDEWVERDDVFIKFLGRHGPLTLGYGSRDRTGVELEFGHVLGEHFEEPVLLIKTAWGGHSLYKNFRPPSAGLPDALLQADLERAVKSTENRNKKNERNDAPPTMDDIRVEYGASYRNMLEEIERTLSEAGTLFPALKGEKLEIAGFLWFQGWNDQYNGAETEYAANMEHFIRDIRKDLEAPDMPVVIGVMGQNMSQPAKGAMKTIQDAQLGMEQVTDFQGNVKAVRTDLLVDKAAEELFPTWQKNLEEWKNTGSDRPYHYLGSAIWHLRMGHAFGEAMIGLIE